MRVLWRNLRKWLRKQTLFAFFFCFFLFLFRPVAVFPHGSICISRFSFSTWEIDALRCLRLFFLFMYTPPFFPLSPSQFSLAFFFVFHKRGVEFGNHGWGIAITKSFLFSSLFFLLNGSWLALVVSWGSAGGIQRVKKIFFSLSLSSHFSRSLSLSRC